MSEKPPPSLQKELDAYIAKLKRHAAGDRNYQVGTGDAVSEILSRHVQAGIREPVTVTLEGLMLRESLRFGGAENLSLTFRQCFFDNVVTINGSIGDVSFEDVRCPGLAIKTSGSNLGVIRISGTCEHLDISDEAEEPLPALPKQFIRELTVNVRKLGSVAIEGFHIGALRIAQANIKQHYLLKNLSVGLLHHDRCHFETAVLLDNIEGRNSSKDRTGITFSITNSRCDKGLEAPRITVEGNSSFSSTRVEGKAIFDEARFNGSVDLEDFVVEGTLSFRSAVLGGPLLLRRISARVSPDVRDIKATSFVGEEAIYCFRELRRWAEQASSQVDASRYFAYEQRAIRKTRARFWTGSFEYPVSRFYDWVSAYGSNISRATAWFVCWNMMFAVTFVLSNNASGGTSYIGKLLPPGAGLALQNMINPLVLFTEKPAFAPITALGFVLSIVQSLGSIVILALLFLAIRRRFHKSSGD